MTFHPDKAIQYTDLSKHQAEWFNQIAKSLNYPTWILGNSNPVKLTVAVKCSPSDMDTLWELFKENYSRLIEHKQ